MKALEHREVFRVEGHEVGAQLQCGRSDHVVDQVDPLVGASILAEQSSSQFRDLVAHRYDSERVEEAANALAFLGAHPAFDLNTCENRNEWACLSKVSEQQLGGFGPAAQMVDQDRGVE